MRLGMFPVAAIAPRPTPLVADDLVNLRRAVFLHPGHRAVGSFAHSDDRGPLRSRRGAEKSGHTRAHLFQTRLNRIRGLVVEREGLEFAKLAPVPCVRARRARHAHSPPRAHVGLRARDMRANAFLALALAAALAPGASGSAAVFASDRRVPTSSTTTRPARTAEWRTRPSARPVSRVPRRRPRPPRRRRRGSPRLGRRRRARARSPRRGARVPRRATRHPADLAHPDVAQRLKRALDHAGSRHRPARRLDLDPSRVDTDVVLAARALADPAARRFVAGAATSTTSPDPSISG